MHHQVKCTSETNLIFWLLKKMVKNKNCGLFNFMSVPMDFKGDQFS